MTASQSLEPFTIDPGTTVGTVALGVADLDGMTRYYERVIGLSVLHNDAESAELGVDGRSIVRLEARPNGKRYPRATGLYHLAILLPSRPDLGHWLKHFVSDQQRMIDGAGDHLVSEALYLSDPEGNGLEIYRDRPRDTWEYEGDRIKMDTLAVDLPAVAAEAPNTPFEGMPAGTILGHVHLQVNDIPKARWFYCDVLGLSYMTGFPSAMFVAAGGYHHHIGGNTWHSLGAEPPPPGSLGLAHYSLVLPTHERRHAVLSRLEDLNYPIEQLDGDPLVTDPAGNRVVLAVG